MSQTPHFTVYEPPRFLEKEPSLEQQMKDLWITVIPLQTQNIKHAIIIEDILENINNFRTRIEALEKKEISER